MNTMTKLVIALTGLFFLTACGGDSASTQSSAGTWQNTYQLTDTTVSMAKDVRIINIPQLSAENKAEMKREFPANMAAVLNAKTRPAFKGAKPAKLQVIVQSISVPNGTGRAFGGTASMTATARLLDAKTGKVIESQSISAEQTAFRGGGLFVPVMLAVNSGTTKTQRYQELSAKFGENLLVAPAGNN